MSGTDNTYQSQNTRAMHAFAGASAKHSRLSGYAFLAAILRERKDIDLDKTPAYFPGCNDDPERPIRDVPLVEGHMQGANSLVIFIGDEVFKTPRHADYMDGFDDERKVLQQLAGAGLPIPKVTHVGQGFVFYGMTRTPGDVLGYKFAPHFTLEEQRDLAKQVVDVVIRIAQATMKENGQFLMHNDLHPENIMIDPATKKLTGIIDFGQMAWCNKNTWAPHENTYGYFADQLRREFYVRKSELPNPSAPAPKGPS